MCAKKDETEIEITSAMIEAGVAEIVTYHRDFESPESLAERLFRAMYGTLGKPRKA